VLYYQQKFKKGFYSMTGLTNKKCEPCRIGTPPLTKQEIEALLPQLSSQWIVVDDHHLERQFSFPDFKSALDFTVKVGQLAEQEGHHPDIQLSWGKVKITLFTHKIKGLSLNDFILSSKIDRIIV
jgi:4a-hydroxytetrahydrobiopterin dehydratase